MPKLLLENILVLVLPPQRRSGGDEASYGFEPIRFWQMVVNQAKAECFEVNVADSDN